MIAQSSEKLAEKQCKPCEGESGAYSSKEARQQLSKLKGWTLLPDGKAIRKEWIVRDFMSGVRFFLRVAKVAEEQDHHPDLHLEGYRDVAIELSTHAVKGLSENDFILAAKIDELPVELKT